MWLSSGVVVRVYVLVLLSGNAQVLEVADKEFPDAQSRPLAMARLGIAHQQALAHGDIISAQQLGAAMSALAEPGDAVHLNLR